MNRLKNKVAVVTGGNSGIGLATAKSFTEEGANVVIFGRDQKSLDAAAQTLGENTLAVRGDVTSDADLDNLFTTATQRFGKVDVIFANAGVAEFLPADAVTNAHFDKIFDINVKGVFKTVQRSLRHLNNGASIVLTTSASNEMGLPATSVYAASKAAVRSFARTLSTDLMRRGIRVNAISPGPVATPIYGRMGLPEAAIGEMENQLAEAAPIGRSAQPREIADVVVFLASSESSYCLGTEFVVDGGASQL